MCLIMSSCSVGITCDHFPGHGHTRGILSKSGLEGENRKKHGNLSQDVLNFSD